MAIILGINAFHPDSAACIVRDGVLVAAVAEERLGKRVKHVAGFPAQAIQSVLRMRLIPNWTDEKAVHPVPKGENPFRQVHNPQDAFLVQYSGTIARIHNVEPLVEAAGLLQDQPILFQFVGEGFKKRKLQEFVREKGLKNVQFLPHQPEARLAEVLSAADLAVVCLDKSFTGSSVPSKTYGIMAAGVPILALLGADSEIGLTLAETGCGVVLPDATGSQVAETIRALRDDPERLRRMGAAGLRAFQDRFTLSKAAAEYDRVLKECFLRPPWLGRGGYQGEFAAWEAAKKMGDRR